MAGPNPRFSIITPTLNQARFIQASINSVLQQEGVGEIELLVMDGGSTDGTLEILGSYGEQVKWVSEPDRGQSHAINKGIARARGTIVGWLNSDDLYRPGALYAVAECFDRNPTTQWVIGRCSIIDEEGRRIRQMITKYKNARLRSWSYAKLLIENFISQPAVFMRKQVLDTIGPVDESRRYDMDYDLWLRLGSAYRPELIPAELAAFRVYDTTITSGDFVSSLRSAHELSRHYSNLAGRPWLGVVNYWFYYQRTALAYRAMALARKLRS
jgi:glycosyltransferase involved in cell wall biosynthesis